MCDQQKSIIEEGFINCENTIINKYFVKEYYALAKSVVADLYSLWNNYKRLKSQCSNGRTYCSNCVIRREELFNIILHMSDLNKLSKFCETFIDTITTHERQSEEFTIDEIRWLYSVPPYCRTEDDVLTKFLIYSPVEFPRMDNFVKEIHEHWDKLNNSGNDESLKTCYACKMLTQNIEIIQKNLENLGSAIKLLSLDYEIFFNFLSCENDKLE